jgi:hypothetical protein
MDFTAFAFAVVMVWSGGPSLLVSKSPIQFSKMVNAQPDPCLTPYSRLFAGTIGLKRTEKPQLEGQISISK